MAHVSVVPYRRLSIALRWVSISGCNYNFLKMSVIPQPKGRGCKVCPPKVNIGICDMVYVGYVKENTSCFLRFEISSGMDPQISQIPGVWFSGKTPRRTFLGRWAPGGIVSIFKKITSKIIFEEFPQVKKRLGGLSLEHWILCCQCWGHSHRRDGEVYQASAIDKFRLVISQNALIGRSG